MRLKDAYIALFLALVLMVSCTLEQVGEVVHEAVFYPLQTGNVWQYDIYSDAGGLSDEVYVLYVARDTSVAYNKEEYDAYVVESFVLPAKLQTWSVFWGHDVYGNVVQYGARFCSQTQLDKSIRYKQSPFVGDAWDYNQLVFRSGEGFEKDSSQMVCVQLDTLIVTKAGAFLCTKYDDSYNRSPGELRVHYVSSEIGLIKSSITLDGEILRELSLRDYSIK